MSGINIYFTYYNQIFYKYIPVNMYYIQQILETSIYFLHISQTCMYFKYITNNIYSKKHVTNKYSTTKYVFQEICIIFKRCQKQILFHKCFNCITNKYVYFNYITKQRLLVTFEGCVLSLLFIIQPSRLYRIKLFTELYLFSNSKTSLNLII